MAPQLTYVIEFVGDMTRAVAFYRDIVGLSLKFESPDWSEFSTGETSLALHPASDKNPAGKLEIGFGVPDLQTFYETMRAKGVTFPLAPKMQDYGGLLAQFQDAEGASVTVSGPLTVAHWQVKRGADDLIRPTRRRIPPGVMVDLGDRLSRRRASR